MKALHAILLTFFLATVALAPAGAADAPRGHLTGGQKYALPGWFKTSFMVLKDDAREADDRGRHLLLFMHLAECPYCSRVLDENLRSGSNKEYVERNFDVVGVDIRGSGNVEWFNGKNYSERQVAGILGVYATPTLVFMDGTGKVVLRLNGYRKPEAMRQAFEYVQGRHYRSQTLAAFVEQRNQAASYQLRRNPAFSDMTDFAGYAKPLAVFFEDKDCVDCEEFHARVLGHAEVRPELAKFKVVRLDAYSDAPIVDIDGNRTTPRAWAHSLQLSYRPGVVFFNEGRERMRMDGMLYHFHFKERLRYVADRHYLDYRSYGAYSAARREELLSQGVVIDYAQ